MKTVIAIRGARAPRAEHSTPRGIRRGIWWWLPIVLAGVYAAALVPALPAIIAHTWWSADSASAGVVAQLYSHPASGQYIILGDHGWYEAFSFYLLTRGLPAHRLLWYVFPTAVWVFTVALIGISAARAFGRYGAALAIAALLCLAPAGLMLVFQPTAHTNVVFHAAVLALVAGWVLPRVRTLPLPGVLGAGVLIGAFTGLAVAGDALALAWAVLPFVVAVAVCAWRGPVADAARTLAFALVALSAMLVVAVLFTAVMHDAGIRVDKLAQSAQMQFVKPSALVGNVGKMLDQLGYLVGGSFLGHRINGDGFLELISGLMLLLGGAAVVLAVYRAAAAAGERRPGGSRIEVSPKLVHVAFWSTCLTVGLLTFLLSSVGSVDYRYLVGPLVAIAALVPVAAGRTRQWRVAVGAGLAVLALAGLYRLEAKPLPYLPRDVTLAHQDLVAIDNFAHRYHATYGYGVYWDAVTITWHTNFAVHLYPVKHCGRHDLRYCALYHSDSFTAAYVPRRRLHTLFIFDGRFGAAPVPSLGRPIASEQVGRLTLYAYSYDIASRLRRARPGEIRAVITGQTPRTVTRRSSRVAEFEHR